MADQVQQQDRQASTERDAMLSAVAKIIGDANRETDKVIAKLADSAISTRKMMVDGLQAAADWQADLSAAMATSNKSLTVLSNAVQRQLAQGRAKPTVRDMLVRVGACHLLAGIDRHRPVAEIAQRRFDDHERVLQALAHKSGSWIARGITNPAATTVATWAAELVGGRNIDGLAALAPASIFSQLSERAAYRVSFAGTGTVMVPSRSKTPAINGSFVGEGGAIPVRRLGLTAAPMTPKKAAVITYFSSEIAAYSAPNIEGVVKQAVAEDTGLMLDTLLLDSVAGDAIRPAGLLNGVTPLPASPGGGIDALAGDIEDLAAMIATTGPLLDPVLITDAASALVVDLIAPGTVPLISGSNVAADTLIMVDAGDLAIGGSGNLDFEISRDALINAADPALPVSSGGAMASPLTSLWQQDLVGLKMVEDITWQMRRPGRVAVITGCTW